MVKIIVILATILLIFTIPVILTAQEQDLQNLQIGVDTAQQLLADIPIDHLEDADEWQGQMPIDQGVIITMRRKGRPLDLPAVDPKDGTKNQYVLAAKVAFNQRGYAEFYLAPPTPIKIPGITKAISMWVCGRSFRHHLFIHLLDYKGDRVVLDMGTLDFVGWKKLSIAIPSTIKQNDYHNTEWRGLSFAGISVKCDPEETYGVYYIYIDEIRAITDIYTEEHRDKDDMEDNW